MPDTERAVAPDSDEHLASRALEALNEAGLAMAAELDLDKVLQLIVDSARDLVEARYSALAVGDWRGGGPGSTQQFVHSGMTPAQARSVKHWPRGVGLLGAVIHEQHSIRATDIGQDPRSSGFPAGHPVMSSFLGVPIIGASETLGNLYLTDKRSGEQFTEEDQRLVEMLAAHAAVAIQNARLYSEVERLAVLEERSRIGMDLHDGVIQSIYAVGLTLESARLALPDGSEETSELLDVAIGALNDSIRDIRNFILDLRPRRFSGDAQMGLASLIREFQANTMIPVNMSMPEPLDELELPAARAIFLTTQEALANIARHARAAEVDVQLETGPDGVTLTIKDNGQGFDTDSEAMRIGHGLANMQARAEGLGGAFTVRSARGQGTTITVVIPRS